MLTFSLHGQGIPSRNPTDQRFHFETQILSANVFLWGLADESLWPQLVNVCYPRPIEHVLLLGTREHLPRAVDEMILRGHTDVSKMELAVDELGLPLTLRHEDVLGTYQFCFVLLSFPVFVVKGVLRTSPCGLRTFRSFSVRDFGQSLLSNTRSTSPPRN